MSAGAGAARRRGLQWILWVGLGLALVAPSYGDTGPGPSFYGTLARSDATLAWSTLQETLESHVSRQAGRWQNGATGSEGSITPLRTYRIASGTYCRDYREMFTMVGRVTARSGTACRNADGVWIPVER